MSTNTSGLSSSDEVDNSMEKRIEVAQRFDREMKDDAKSSLKEFLGIHDQDSSSQAYVSPMTMTSSLEYSTLSDGIKIKEEEDIAEEKQPSSVISYQSFGSINFAVVSACPDSFESQQNSSDVSTTALPESTLETTIDASSTQHELFQVNEQESNRLRQQYFEEKKQHDACKCNVCGMICASASELLIHKRTHSRVKRFKCELCDKVFDRFKRLMSHQSVHTGEKPFQCDVCDKKFTSSSTLSVHKRKHIQAKPFQCDLCEKKYAGANGLRYHKMTHAREKLLNCDVCGMKFTYSTLSSHACCHKKARVDINEKEDSSLQPQETALTHDRLHECLTGQ